MSENPQLPPFGRNNPSNSGNQNREVQNQIVWQDSDDVYRPIPMNLAQFLYERKIDIRYSTKIYIKAEALQRIKHHLSSNLRVEQGGILLGNAYKDDTLGIYVEITASVDAPATIGSGSHLEFTPDSWVGIMNYAKREHPDENIVGWYHSHPNLSVFMSGTDMRTQQAFFYHPWSLSIVHDPVQGDTGFFLGKDALRVQPIIYDESSFYFHSYREQYNSNNRFVSQSSPSSQPKIEHWDKIPEPDIKREQRKKEKDFQNRLIFLTVAILMLLILAIAFPKILSSIISNNPNNNDPTQTITNNNNIYPLKAEIRTMSSKEFNSFRELQKSSSIPKNLVYSPVVGEANKIGRGSEITTLLITPTLDKSIKNLTLEYEQLELKNDQPIKIEDHSLNSLSTSLSDFSEEQKKNLSIDNLEIGEGIVFFMYSSFPTETESTTTGGINQVKSIKDIVYFPKTIKYLDESRQSKTIDIKEIVINSEN